MREATFFANVKNIYFFFIKNILFTVNLARTIQNMYNRNPKPILTVLKPVIDRTITKIFKDQADKTLKSLNVDELLLR